MEKKNKIFKKLKISEAIGGALSNAGISVFAYSYTASYMMLYYTNSVGISAAFLGTLMLVARIFDAVSDVTMGAVIEKTNSKWGKARPWVLWGIFPMVVLMMLMFHVPKALSATGKNIYVSVTYTAGVVIVMTILIMAQHSCVTRMCSDSIDRGIFYSICPVLSNVFMIAVVVAVPYLLDAFGGNTNQHAWTLVTVIMCIGLTVFTLIGFFLVKEHSNDGREQQEIQAEDNVSLWEKGKIALFNKYFILLLILGLCIWGGAGVSSSVNIYYATYVLKSNTAFTFMTFASALPAIIMAPFCVGLFKKYGKMLPTIVGAIIMVACKVMVLFQPYNSAWFVIWSFLSSLAAAPLGGMVFSLPGDISELGELKYGIRTDALSSSSMSFASKVGVGLASAIVGWGLAIGKFDAALATQSQYTITALVVINVVIPIIFGVISVVILCFWDIEKKIVQLKSAKQTIAE